MSLGSIMVIGGTMGALISMMILPYFFNEWIALLSIPFSFIAFTGIFYQNIVERNRCFEP